MPIYGQSETITATVAVPSSSTAALPSEGTVTFSDGGAPLGTSNVTAGVAALTTSTLAVGAHSISASYSGSGNFAPSSSAGVQSVVPVSGLSLPEGVALDGLGDLFIADGGQGRVVEETALGTQTTVASGLSGPVGVAVDAARDVFVADAFASKVLEITPGGAQLTVGSGFDLPQGVALNAAGDVFVADSGHNRVLELAPSSTPTLGAGIQGVMGEVTWTVTQTFGSGLNDPEGVAVDSSGDVFIADTGNNRVVEVTQSGTQHTVAFGIPSPHSVAVDASGNLFIAAGQLLEVTTSGTELTQGAGIGIATGVTVNAAGDAFVSDGGNDQVLEVAPITVSPVPTTIRLAASSATTAFGQSQTFTAIVNVPSGSMAPNLGNVTFWDGTTPLGTAAVSSNPFHAASEATFTTSSLSMGSHAITASFGGTTQFAASTSTQSVVPTSLLSGPSGVAVDATGDVFIADFQNNRVVEVLPSGTQQTLISGLNSPTGVAVDSAGDVFVADTMNNRVLELAPSGTQTIGSGLSHPEGVAVDATGDVFIADTDNCRVVEVTPSGTQTTLTDCDDQPTGVAVDSAGDVFIAESLANEVLEVSSSVHRRSSARDWNSLRAWQSTARMMCSLPNRSRASCSGCRARARRRRPSAQGSPSPRIRL